METGLRAHIPADQRARAKARLPGLAPVGQLDWITVDAHYADQMAEKQRLIRDHLDAVYQMLPTARVVAQELLDHVLELLAQRADFSLQSSTVICPDGRTVMVSGDPMLVLGKLLQEDLCLHLKTDGAHHLIGALLCFPASWTLAEKLGKPLCLVHRTVPEYTPDLAARVQRLFDGVQAEQPIWRANCLVTDDPALFQPRKEADPRATTANAKFERSERQTLLRLPKTGAVAFAIHTTVAAV